MISRYFRGFLLDYIGFYWVVLGFTGFSWVSLGFYRVLLDFSSIFYSLSTFSLISKDFCGFLLNCIGLY